MGIKEDGKVVGCSTKEEMIWKCQRCTEVLADSDDVLCPECLLVMGKPPTSQHNVCDYCGDEWIQAETIMCDKCLADFDAGPFMN